MFLSKVSTYNFLNFVTYKKYFFLKTKKFYFTNSLFIFIINKYVSHSENKIINKVIINKK